MRSSSSVWEYCHRSVGSREFYNSDTAPPFRSRVSPPAFSHRLLALLRCVDPAHAAGNLQCMRAILSQEVRMLPLWKRSIAVALMVVLAFTMLLPLDARAQGPKNGS